MLSFAPLREALTVRSVFWMNSYKCRYVRLKLCNHHKLLRWTGTGREYTVCYPDHWWEHETLYNIRRICIWKVSITVIRELKREKITYFIALNTERRCIIKDVSCLLHFNETRFMKLGDTVKSGMTSSQRPHIRGGDTAAHLAASCWLLQCIVFPLLMENITSLTFP